MRSIVEESSNRPKGGWVIGITFLVAIVLTILPFPSWAVWFRPDWVLLVIIFWTLTCSDRVGIITSWLIGFFLDILLSSILGEHALAFSLVAYFCIKFHLRINSLFLWRKVVVILLLILLYKSVLFWIQGFIGQLPDYHLYWLSVLTSLLVWPWVFIVLRDCYGLFKLS